MVVFLLCGALEEAMPRIYSVGFPFLMMAALILGCVRTLTGAVLLSVLAGTMEDALSVLPLTTTTSFLLLVVLCARAWPTPCLVPILAYPAYQLWLVVWTDLPAGELWSRLLVSVPVAAVTVLIMRPILLTCERRWVDDAR